MELIFFHIKIIIKQIDILYELYKLYVFVYLLEILINK